MSATKIGKVAPFPPLPGQPYPPARNHPRWKELYRLHDEWLMKYWPFSSEKKRARVPFMNLAGFSTWCAPASDFDRMVWGGRIAGIFFLADDYIDSGKMLDRIPGFKKAATGEGPLHEGDKAEACHDVVFRAIQATSHPRTFEQLTKCTHEWWDSNIHEPFKNLDQYLSVRRVNIAMYFANAYFRYCLDINLTDEQVNHPLMREAEGIVSDHVGLTNDFFSYLKEKLTNSDDTNIIRILMDHEHLTYEEAKVVIEKKIRQKEQDFIPAGLAVLNDPVLGSDPEVHRWIANLPYCMGGNNAWSQESGRYNVGNIDGEVSFPSLSFEVEATPEDEVVDDTEESALRDAVFNVKDVPPPDFTIDDDPAIISGSLDAAGRKNLDVKNVGIIGLEVYVPKRFVSLEEVEQSAGLPGKYTVGLNQHRLGFADDREDINSIALSTVSSLLEKYGIDPQKVGRVDVATETVINNCQSVRTTLMDLFAASANHDIEGVQSTTGSYGSTAALFNSINWIESTSWDGRYAVVFAGGMDYADESILPPGGAGAVAILIGPDAPLVPEFAHGRYTANTKDTSSANESFSTKDYLNALDETYSSYRRKVQAASKVGPDDAMTSIPTVKLSDFDHTVFHAPYGNLAQQAHARLMYLDYVARPESRVFREVPPTLLNVSRVESLGGCDGLSFTFGFWAMRQHDLRLLYGNLASLLTSVPSYELFDKRIAMFAYGGSDSAFYTIRVKGDTSRIRNSLDLVGRLAQMQAKPSAEYFQALKLLQAARDAKAYKPNGALENIQPGQFYLESIDGRYRRLYGVAPK